MTTLLHHRTHDAADERALFAPSLLIRVAKLCIGVFLTWAFSLGPNPAAYHIRSLDWLHELLPWTAFAVIFAVYTALLTAALLGARSAAVAGNALGATVFTLALVAIVVTWGQRPPANPFYIAGLVFAVTLHLRATWTAVQFSIQRG